MSAGGGRRARAVAAVAAAAALVLSAAPAARAGSLQVRDPAGNRWEVSENAGTDHDDFLLRRTDPHGVSAAGFGRGGVLEFSTGPDEDDPASLRVEPSGRAWMVATGTGSGRPQPIVLRVTPDGQMDTRWGVQGLMQVSVLGLSIHATDLLPLADGGVLVSGEAAGLPVSHAVVVKLKADGSLDPAFGDGGVWRRPGPEGAAAVSLGATEDSGVAVGVSVRGNAPTTEVWSLYDRPPQLLERDALDDPNADEDDMHIVWVGHHWQWAMAPETRATLAPVSLAPPAPAAPSAPADPGQGGFNPFAHGAEAAASSPATSPAPGEDGPSWGWIAAVAAGGVGLLGFVFLRAGRAGTAAAARRR